MANPVLIPKTVTELVKIAARKGKDIVFISGADGSDRPSGGKATVDISHISSLHEVSVKKDKVVIGSGLNLGRLSREATGENDCFVKPPCWWQIPWFEIASLSWRRSIQPRPTLTSRLHWSC